MPTSHCPPNGICELDVLAAGNPSRGFVLQGEAKGDYSGVAVGSAGDVNGDGFADIMVGAYDATSTSRFRAGKTYILFGSNSVTAWGSGILDLSTLMNGIRGFVLQGEAMDDQSGGSVSSAGDINGDGLTDILIGAYYATPASRAQAGKTYVVFGSNSSTAWCSAVLDLSTLMNGIRGFVLQGEVSNDWSGYSVSKAGDINGDGLMDILIGAYDAAPVGRTSAGKTYIVFGSKNPTAWGSGALDLSTLMNGVSGFVLQGEASSDHSGGSVSSAGDINGDGLVDILIGARYADPAGRTDAGKTYVVFGNNSSNAWASGILDLSTLMDGIRGFVLQGETSGDNSGLSVSSAGDINGDGLMDILIGAWYAAPTGIFHAGKTYVIFGSNSTSAWGNGVLDLGTLMNGIRGFFLQGEAYADQSGWSVSRAGDINSDGFGDLLIGSFNRSYVIFGGLSVGANGIKALSGLNGNNGFMINRESGDSRYGASATFVGDVNGDGREDLLIGNSGFNNATGRSYLVFNVPGLLQTPTLTPTLFPTLLPTLFPTLVPTLFSTTSIPTLSPTTRISTPTLSTIHSLEENASALATSLGVSFGTVGTIILAILAYLYKKYHFKNRRENENAFANAVQERLKLSYADFFNEGPGKGYADAMTELRLLLKTRSNVDLNKLSKSTTAVEQNRYQRYVDLTAQAISNHGIVYDTCCKTGHALRVQELNDQRESIVEEVIREASCGLERTTQPAASTGFLSACCPLRRKKLSGLELREMKEEQRILATSDDLKQELEALPSPS